MGVLSCSTECITHIAEHTGSSKNVIPAQAGIQNQPKLLHSRTCALQGIRGSDRLVIIRDTHIS